MVEKKQLVTVNKLQPTLNVRNHQFLSVHRHLQLTPYSCVFFLQGSLWKKERLKQTPSRQRLCVNKTAVSEVIFGASGGNLAGLHFLFTRVSSHSQSCCLLVVVPGRASACCKHPVIMESVTFRLCMELSPLTATLFPAILHLAFRK